MVTDGAGAGSEQVKSSLLNYLELQNTRSQQINQKLRILKAGGYHLTGVCLKVTDLRVFNIWKETDMELCHLPTKFRSMSWKAFEKL